ncbi:MAG: spore cortex-lytic enzyme [Clostridia bacterium]|nr:spore cortex-lytic enzyme [Clostridia bacterium]
MNRKKLYEVICVLTVIAIFASSLIIGESYFYGSNDFIGISENDEVIAEAQDALSKRGSYGSEVRQIQTKLKNWGYYNGDIDGIYGSRTESAVKSFQRKNGLTVDGIAGPATLAAMGISSGSSGSTSVSASSANVELLARIIYGEARGEPYAGQVAIAAVVLNRVEDSRFPKTISGVIYQSGAFDAVSDGQINYTPNSTAYQAARDALNGWDPTYGSIYYYNPVTATNRWIKTLPITVTIGKHVFSVGK